MNFDKIIMNPPYGKLIYLYILREAIKHLNKKGELVNLSPRCLITNVKNIFSDLAIKKFNKFKDIFQHLKDVDIITRGDKSFNAYLTNIGIQTYTEAVRNVQPASFATTILSHDLVKKIMKKCMENNIKKNKGSGNYKLNYSGIHGHVDDIDFYCIFSIYYDKQLECKSCYEVYFESEEDRLAFFNFWKSSMGKLITKLWKYNFNIIRDYIPYFWCDTLEEFSKYFELTEEEIKEVNKEIKQIEFETEKLYETKRNYKK